MEDNKTNNNPSSESYNFTDTSNHKSENAPESGAAQQHHDPTNIDSGHEENKEAQVDEAEVSAVLAYEPQIKQSFADLLYGIIVKPVQTLRYLANEKPWVKGMLVYVVVSWIATVASLPSQSEQFEQLEAFSGASDFNIGAAIVLAIILLLPVFSAIGLFAISGIYHLLAKLLKGRGDFKGIIASIGFANFPSILITPFYLFFLIGGSIAEVIALALTLSASFAFGIWVLALNVLAIRENYKLSTTRAVAVFLIPIAAITVLVVFLVILFVALIAASVPQT